MSGMSSTDEDGDRKMDEVSLQRHSLSSCDVAVVDSFGCRTERGGVACECDRVGSLDTAEDDRGGVRGIVSAVATLTTDLAAEVCTGSVESPLRFRIISMDAAERSWDTVDKGWLLLMMVVVLVLLLLLCVSGGKVLFVTWAGFVEVEREELATTRRHTSTASRLFSPLNRLTNSSPRPQKV